jgi:hypothetical protein
VRVLDVIGDVVIGHVDDLLFGNSVADH